MKLRVPLLISLLTMLSAFPFRTQAQGVEVSRSNRTIAVTAEEEVTADAEIAVVKVGYETYGPTKDAAFDESTRVAASIIKAISDAGVPKSDIETDSVRLTQTDVGDKPTEWEKQRLFHAVQIWKVRVPAAAAESVVDKAVRGGANKIEAVEWTVSNPAALQAKADAAALKKAQATAEQMAQALGAKLGVLVYASNASNEQGLSDLVLLTPGAVSYVTKSGSSSVTNLKIFPEKVRSKGFVRAVFAIE